METDMVVPVKAYALVGGDRKIRGGNYQVMVFWTKAMAKESQLPGEAIVPVVIHQERGNHGC